MRTPKAEKEDPALVAAREREQARAEATRTEETQALLMGATIRRNRRFGKLNPSGGSVPIYGGAAGGTSGAALASGGGGSISGGGGGSFSNGGTQMQTVLY